jgi:DNA helicase-2/ATP-dependent DNA helicase PcrA
VLHVDGPLLILAGAGSGKTRVITHRIAYLIGAHGVAPWQILALTFTNKAAEEMRSRIEKLLGASSREVWVSTFHFACVRMLRHHIENLGRHTRSFIILDTADQSSLIKECLRELNISPDRYAPQAIAGRISRLKNGQLMTAEQFTQGGAQNFGFEEAVRRVYQLYQKKLVEQNALDFDDLLMQTVQIFEEVPEVLRYYQQKFRYILVDEYQDTNHAQYRIIRLLAAEHRNLCVVGDDDQCLPPGTMIQTPMGPKAVERLRDGEQVISATGWGTSGVMTVDKVAMRPYKGPLVHIYFEGGEEVRATPNHLCFARLRPDPSLHYVYLMWKQGVGYRIGVTRGLRSSKGGDILSGLQVRTNQEVADAVWILRSCRSSAEARFYEHFLSVRYGIPTMVFFVRGRRMDITQAWIDRLYADIDSESAAARLMSDLQLDPRSPQHRPGAVTRGDIARRYVLFTMFGDTRPHTLRPWHEHRIQLVTSDPALRAAAAPRFPVRNGTKGTWRIETSRKSYEEGLALVRDICGLGGLDVVPRARLTRSKAFLFMPASHIHPGMIVPVFEGERIVERLVTAVDWEDYEGTVYDLSVPNTRNYIANGLVVHNSIYAWRGADISNILSFERDYPDCAVVKLEENYRSTKSILEAAGGVIDKNTARKGKHLWTQREAGENLTYFEAVDETHEASIICQMIRRLRLSSGWDYRDVAIFYRTNAQSRAIEDALRMENIPYQIVGGLKFYERKEVKDLLAYLRMVANPRDSVSLRRVINVPPRGIGKVTLDKITAHAELRGIPLYDAVGGVLATGLLSGGTAGKVKQFYALVEDLRELATTSSVAEFIRELIRRTNFLDQYGTAGEDEMRRQNIQEVITAADDFEGRAQDPSLASFLDQAALMADQDTLIDDAGRVVLMTLHTSKGLEFPVVFVSGMEDGIFPHRRAFEDASELEEERRLCYVGMTRAKDRLFLTSAVRRRIYGTELYNPPSMFLQDIPPALLNAERAPQQGVGTRQGRMTWGRGDSIQGDGTALGVRPSSPVGSGASDLHRDSKPDTRQLWGGEYRPGTLVRHPEWGLGVVQKQEGEGESLKLTIIFRDVGRKVVAAKYAKLEKVSS